MPTKKPPVNHKQFECDRFAESVLTDLFGKPKVPAFLDVFLRNRGFDIQAKLEEFESFIQEFMDDDGKVRGADLRRVIAERNPRASEFIPDEDFRLIDQWQGMVSVTKTIFLGA